MATEGNLCSAKNHKHALSLLVFCDANKQLLGLTPCIYGSVKDDDFLIRTSEYWVNQLTLHDKEFADSGFRLRDETREKYPITSQFCIYTPIRPHSSDEYKYHSEKRIAVENIIADLKK